MRVRGTREKRTRTYIMYTWAVTGVHTVISVCTFAVFKKGRDVVRRGFSASPAT